jgi:CubicO group peptidase (beta-lactamase class C family)
MEHYSSMTEPEHLGVDPERLQAVVDFLDAEFASGSFPGAALLATRRGKSVLCEYRGTYCGRVTRDEPYRSDVVNMCFSFSKVITATVVVMAQQDSLFDYDAPVSTYIPAFKGGGKDRITVRQCLTHSAGIPGPPMVAALTEEGWQRNLDALCKHDVEWPPGSKTDYHAWSGAFLSAAVVRAVSGMKPWNEICRERLFDPLGADTMTFGLPRRMWPWRSHHSPRVCPRPWMPHISACWGIPGAVVLRRRTICCGCSNCILRAECGTGSG